MGTTRTRFLHVVNGTCTTRVIEAAGIPGRLSVWGDPLYEGPVPGDLSDDELLDVRARFLAGSDEAAADVASELRTSRSAIEQHDAYDELVLWYEHDLFDQLNLIQLLPWIEERVPATKPVSVVPVKWLAKRPGVKGLGELTPAELAPLFDTRQPVTKEQCSYARRAWDTFRKPTPEALDRLRQESSANMPYLGPALTRFLQEYPWTSDGLSRSERRLLALASGPGLTLRQALPLMHDGENAYYITDASLAHLAAVLSDSPVRLLSLTKAAEPSGGTFAAHIVLTEIGQAVLAGREDRVRLCGMDRWFGGVRLQGTGDMWRWDAAAARIVHM